MNRLSWKPFWGEILLPYYILAIVLYLYFEYLKKDILSGVSLGILLYKPTFLIIILPMILIARRTKIILGFCICSIMIIFLSILAVGFETCIGYMRFLLGLSTTNYSAGEIFRTWKYVDIFSFSRLLLGTITPAVLIIIAIISLIPFIFLIKQWWRLSGLNKSNQELLNASAITLTTVINPHFGIYDTVILVPSTLLTLNILYRNSKVYHINELNPSFEALLVSIYILPWITQYTASSIGLQVFTIAIVILAIYQITFARTLPNLYRTPTE